MRPHERALIEGAIDVGLDGPIDPLREGPLRVRIVLRLDRE